MFEKLKFFFSFCLSISVILEWSNVTVPCWIILWHRSNWMKFSKLDDVSDFHLLKLKICIKDTIMELSKESHWISMRHINFLSNINRNASFNLWCLISSFLSEFNWLWNSHHWFLVIGEFKSILEILEWFSIHKWLVICWVEMSKVVSEFLCAFFSIFISC